MKHMLASRFWMRSIAFLLVTLMWISMIPVSVHAAEIPAAGTITFNPAGETVSKKFIKPSDWGMDSDTVALSIAVENGKAVLPLGTVGLNKNNEARTECLKFTNPQKVPFVKNANGKTNLRIDVEYLEDGQNGELFVEMTNSGVANQKFATGSTASNSFKIKTFILEDLTIADNSRFYVKANNGIVKIASVSISAVPAKMAQITFNATNKVSTPTFGVGVGSGNLALSSATANGTTYFVHTISDWNSRLKCWDIPNWGFTSNDTTAAKALVMVKYLADSTANKVVKLRYYNGTQVNTTKVVLETTNIPTWKTAILEIPTWATHSSSGDNRFFVEADGESPAIAVADVTIIELPAGHTHNYDQQIANAERYLKSAATCESPAVYYMSCTCGAKKNATFTYGDKDMTNHTKSTFVYTDNEDGATHTKKYECCGTVANATDAHNFGNDAVCDLCNYVSGYTVTFNANGGTGTMDPVASAGATFVLPACTFTAPENKQFKGWATEKINPSVTYLTNTQYGITAATTFYAIWEDIPATITAVEVKPETINVQQGTTQQFNAAVTGTGEYARTVVWSISGNNKTGTTISADGLLTVAADEPKDTVITVTAQSTADAAKRDTATVKVTEIPHTHTYDKEVKDAKYLKTPGDCLTEAVYYKSCECGQYETSESAATFKGDKDATKHQKDTFTYVNNNDGATHTKKNECCDAVVDAAEAHRYSGDICVCGAKKPVDPTPTPDDGSTLAGKITFSAAGTEKKNQYVYPKGWGLDSSSDVVTVETVSGKDVLLVGKTGTNNRKADVKIYNPHQIAFEKDAFAQVNLKVDVEYYDDGSNGAIRLRFIGSPDDKALEPISIGSNGSNIFKTATFTIKGLSFNSGSRVFVEATSGIVKVASVTLSTLPADKIEAKQVELNFTQSGGVLTPENAGTAGQNNSDKFVLSTKTAGGVTKTVHTISDHNSQIKFYNLSKMGFAATPSAPAHVTVAVTYYADPSTGKSLKLDYMSVDGNGQPLNITGVALNTEQPATAAWKTVYFDLPQWLPNDSASRLRIRADGVVSVANVTITEVPKAPVAGGFKVTFVPNGGSNVPETTTNVAGILTDIPTSTRDGYRFLGWTTLDGAPIDWSKPLTADLTVVAQWERVVEDTVIDSSKIWFAVLVKLYNQEFTISASASEGGTISSPGDSIIKYNRKIDFTFTPDEGYAVAHVIVDGVDIGAVDSYSFKKVQDDHTITVLFEKID